MSYKDLLDRADAFFHDQRRAHPQHFQCSGCSLCCYGLFEIGAADIPMIAEGLSKLHPSRRKMIVRRALEILESDHPDIRTCSAAEKDAFFKRTASVACPNLNDAGRCMIYDHRPLVCRTFGLPLRDGDRYLGDICELNFTQATDKQKRAAAWDLQWEDELDPEEEYTIPEAIVRIARLRGWV